MSGKEVTPEPVFLASWGPVGRKCPLCPAAARPGDILRGIAGTGHHLSFKHINSVSLQRSPGRSVL